MELMINKKRVIVLIFFFTFLLVHSSFARRSKEQDMFSWLDVYIAENVLEREQLLEASYRNGSPILSFTNPNEVSEYLIARDSRSGEIIAGYHYIFKPSCNEDLYLDGNIFVALEYRGQGIGLEIFQRLINSVKNRGYNGLYFYVLEDVVNFYERFGAIILHRTIFDRLFKIQKMYYNILDN